MIQKTNSRQASSSAGPLVQPQTQTASEGREIWGKWVRGKHYSLEIVQHPIRARMCGFGDKDRRPLAPAAVAKLVIKREDDSIVDVDGIDYTFFLATVDLWSEDGKQEMNLVLHPTSADRYVPAQGPKTRKRVTTARSNRQSDSATPTPASATSGATYNLRSHTEQPDANPGPPNSASGQGFPASYPVQSQQSPVESVGYHSVQQSTSAEWNFNSQQSPIDNRSQAAPVLPSIQAFGRGNQTNENWQQQGDPLVRPDSEAPPYRPWPPDATFSAVDSAQAQNIDPSLRTAQSDPSNHDPRAHGSSWNQVPLASTSDGFSQNRYTQTQPQQEHMTTAVTNPTSSPIDNSAYTSTSYAQNQPYYQPSHIQDGFPSGSTIPLPRHTYTRTLVGPLCANASRLLDEHRKPGIFFLFQDLSIRTEGVFCLRIRLMNVGASPAPETGAFRVHNDISPVLAQTFTDSFTVYSAKRFPGVPDTTALSIAFGNQGQKLPLRNRHGSAKTRKRQRSVSDGDTEEESD